MAGLAMAAHSYRRAAAMFKEICHPALTHMLRNSKLVSIRASRCNVFVLRRVFRENEDSLSIEAVELLDVTILPTNNPALL